MTSVTSASAPDTALAYARTHPAVPTGTTVITDSTCAQPPAQSVQDHAGLSDTELVQYGLEPRPQPSAYPRSTAAYQQAVTDWSARVRAISARSCAFTTTDTYNTVSYNTPVPGGSSYDGYAQQDSTMQSPNHGNMTPGGQADWFAQCGMTTGTDARRSAWLGDGGLNAGELFQAGVESDEDFLGGIDTALWFENIGPQNIGSPQQTITPPSGHSMKCGDHVHVAIDQNCYYVADITNGWAQGTSCYGPLPDYNSLELIVERPDSAAFPLTHVYTETYYNLQIRHSDESWDMWQNLGMPEEYNMWDSPSDFYRLQLHTSMMVYLQHLSNEFQSWWQNKN